MFELQVYTVRNEEDLKELATERGVQPSNFKQLVGLQKNSSSGLAKEKSGWRFLGAGGEVWWIRRSPGFRPLRSVATLPRVAPFKG